MGLLTGLYRSYQLYRHRPAHWRLRPGTIDRRLFREVVIEDGYRLPARFGPGDVVVDVGAHTGSFAYAVLRRGAGAVHCCEASRANFRLLTHNLEPYRGRVELVHGAVWRSDRLTTHLHFRNTVDPRNTGAGSVVGGADGERVPVLAFDNLLARAALGGKRVRLVKLDCEGSEWPILLTSRLLPLAEAVCGEYHLGEFPEAFAVAGYPEFTPAVLERHLAGQGFRVRLEPHARDERFGLFFAERVARAARAG